MRFYEYESKALFAKHRMPLPKSRLAHSAAEPADQLMRAVDDAAPAQEAVRHVVVHDALHGHSGGAQAFGVAKAVVAQRVDAGDGDPGRRHAVELGLERPRAVG